MLTRSEEPFLSNVLQSPGREGAGEAGCVGALPAVGNALVDALSHLSVEDVPMPASPLVWRPISDRTQAYLSRKSLQLSSLEMAKRAESPVGAQQNSF